MTAEAEPGHGDFAGVLVTFDQDIEPSNCDPANWILDSDASVGPIIGANRGSFLNELELLCTIGAAATFITVQYAPIIADVEHNGAFLEPFGPAPVTLP